MSAPMLRRVFLLAPAVLAGLCLPAQETARLQLPLKQKSVRFAVIGDMGTGGRDQYETARQMAAFRQRFPFDFVITVGDNIYGGESAADFKRKFETPYGPLLEAGVKFYASLGNHDRPDQRFYKPFNMDGKRYYSFQKGPAEFFALDSNYMDSEQLDWLNKELGASRSAWKICYFHHPLYNDGKAHGPDKDLRALLEPVFQKNEVNIVFSGHEHVYQRIKPQKGIYYFVVGNSGKLNTRNLRNSDEIVKGFDSDRTFLLVEIAGDALYFQSISRAGETVDSGVIDRQMLKAGGTGAE